MWRISKNLGPAKIGHRKILKASLIDRGENSESIPHGPRSGKNQKYFSKILDFENPKGGVREVAAAPAKFQLKKLRFSRKKKLKKSNFFSDFFERLEWWGIVRGVKLHRLQGFYEVLSTRSRDLGWWGWEIRVWGGGGWGGGGRCAR